MRDERSKSGSIIAFGVTRDKAIERMTSQGGDFELVVNLKTAAALGMTVTPSLIGSADHVIE